MLEKWLSTYKYTHANPARRNVKLCDVIKTDFVLYHLSCYSVCVWFSSYVPLVANRNGRNFHFRKRIVDDPSIVTHLNSIMASKASRVILWKYRKKISIRLYTWEDIYKMKLHKINSRANNLPDRPIPLSFSFIWFYLKKPLEDFLICLLLL